MHTYTYTHTHTHGSVIKKKKIFCRFATLRHGDTSVPDGLSR
jgi:hypothetical protein